MNYSLRESIMDPPGLGQEQLVEVARRVYPDAIRVHPYYLNRPDIDFVVLHVRVPVPPGENNKYRWLTYWDGLFYTRRLRPPGLEPLYRYYEARTWLDSREARGELWITEGERDADTLWSHGYCAITHPDGAVELGQQPKWSEDHTLAVLWLRPKAVVVVADADKPGLYTAEHITRSLRKTAIDRVQIVKPPDGQDLTEWWG